MTNDALPSASDVVSGNVYDKYHTRNPIARWLMSGFEREFKQLVLQAGKPRSILEVGCGEGELLKRLSLLFPDAELLGTDLSPVVIAEARRRHGELAFQELSVHDLGQLGRRFDLVVAAEVLEHLEEPQRALRDLSLVAKDHLFLSVPREPLWRMLNCARGKYLSAWGNTPGHLQHWSSHRFLALLRRELDVLAVRQPIPWTQALCRVRPR
jgi:2-polyprenyl-3-methyl-5-hydroxy-6-metoxy-1,4-benzoquinol methylase